MNDQTPMKMSMKILTVDVAPSIQPGWYCTPCAAADESSSDSVIAPLATAAPSVLTARPIHAPATIGSFTRKRLAVHGSNKSSITAKITTSDETMMGTIGRARIAAAVAIAAETPQ